MARVHHVKKAQARYETVPVLDEDGNVKKTPVMRNGVQRTKKNGSPIFRTVTKVDTTKPKANRKCEKCGVEIKVGDPYKWVQTKTQYGGIKHVRCASCPTWTQSELSSSKMSSVYAAQESFSTDGLNSIEDLESARDDFVGEVESVRDEYQESYDNIQQHFSESPMLDELQEKIDALESWIDELQGIDFDEPPQCEECDGAGNMECNTCGGNGTVQSEDGGETEDCPDCEGTGTVDCENCEDGNITDTSEGWGDYIQEQADKLTDEVNNSPL